MSYNCMQYDTARYLVITLLESVRIQTARAAVQCVSEQCLRSSWRCNFLWWRVCIQDCEFLMQLYMSLYAFFIRNNEFRWVALMVESPLETSLRLSVQVQDVCTLHRWRKAGTEGSRMANLASHASCIPCICGQIFRGRPYELDSTRQILWMNPLLSSSVDEHYLQDSVL